MSTAKLLCGYPQETEDVSEGITYQSVQELRDDPQLGHYRTYGIRVSRRVAQSWALVEQIHDVTTDRESAERLTEQLTRCRLSPLHLRDVLEDLLLAQ